MSTPEDSHDPLFDRSASLRSAELSSITAQIRTLAQRVEELLAMVDSESERHGDRSRLLEAERHIRCALRELERTRRP